MFPNPPGLLRVEPHSDGLRDRIWWGAASNATAVWAAQLGMNLQSSTLKTDETGEPLHIQQAAQIRAYREAWKEAGHTRAPRVSVSRSIFAIVNDQDRMYFGGSGESQDHIGMLHGGIRAVFGRSYADEPDRLVKQLAQDDAIAEVDREAEPVGSPYSAAIAFLPRMPRISQAWSTEATSSPRDSTICTARETSSALPEASLPREI
jgi:alkanesulfonate monooxygenase SsuD/methylene tetrahydromethanopterin reductase-like flavin-dependent oxidoreductase (luciferase family)